MAFAGGLLAGLAGLAEAPGAYQSARRKSQEIEGGDISLNDARMSALGKAAMGSVVGQGEQIAGLGGGPSSLSLAVPGQIPPQPQGGGPQGAPGMPPGAPSQPMAPQPFGDPRQGSTRFPAPGQQSFSQQPGGPGGPPPPPSPFGGPGGPGGPPTPQMQGMPGMSPGGPPMRAMAPQQPGGMAPQPRPPMPPGPPGGMPPGAPQPPGAGPPGGGNMAQHGSLNLQQLAQAIRQHNPNLPPQAMFEALKAGVGLLRPEEQMQLRQMELLMRQQGLGIQEQRVSETAAHNKATEEHQRETLQLKRENMERLAGQYQQTLDAKRQFQQSQLDNQLQRLQQGDRRLDLAQIHSEIDASHKRAMEEIQSFSAMNGMDIKLKESIMKSQFEFYKEQIEKLEAAGKPAAKGGATGPRTEAAGSGQTAQAGEVRDYQGKKYKFKGGDQYAQNNWQEVSTA